MNPRALTDNQKERIGFHAYQVSITDASRKFGISRTLARRCLNWMSLPSRRPGNYTKQQRETIKLHK